VIVTDRRVAPLQHGRCERRPTYDGPGDPRYTKQNRGDVLRHVSPHRVLFIPRLTTHTRRFYAWLRGVTNADIGTLHTQLHIAFAETRRIVSRMYLVSHGTYDSTLHIGILEYFQRPESGYTPPDSIVNAVHDAFKSIPCPNLADETLKICLVMRMWFRHNTTETYFEKGTVYDDRTMMPALFNQTPRPPHADPGIEWAVEYCIIPLIQALYIDQQGTHVTTTLTRAIVVISSRTTTAVEQREPTTHRSSNRLQ
jgi:hypothetical protein